MNRRLVVCTEKRFTRNQKGEIVNEDNTRSNYFWSRYLKHFNFVIVVARVNEEGTSNCENEVESKNIKVFPVSNFHGFKEGVLTLNTVKKEIGRLISQESQSSYLLRTPGTIANILGAALLKNRKKYSVEIVGDPFDVFKSKRGVLSGILAHKERLSMKKLIFHAFSASYVTEFALQKRYPFKGAFETHYSSIHLDSRFLNAEKVFSSKPLSMIGIGSLEMPYKGVEILLLALSELHKRHIDFALNWIGTGKLLRSYQELTSKLELNSKVNFLGAIPNEQIPQFLQESNVFILPSLTEGLPRAMIEAMASGLICLGSSVGGIPELLTEECMFPSNDVKALKRKLIEVNAHFSNFRKYSGINYRESKKFLPEVLEERRNKFLETIQSN